jgi:predicted ATPase
VIEGSLPVALSSMVGRQREIDALTRLLSAARMVTIVGSGGAGKTRLALTVARRASARFPDGVCWADLARLTCAGLLPGVVASALGVPQSPDEDLTSVIARHVRENVALLILDSCEQLVAESAKLAERTLHAAPGVKVLATSREVIGVSGEQVFRVGGLGLPVPGGEPRASEAVQLFAERAAQAVGGLNLGPAELESAARLCRRLDGMPLAIELAAARVGSLGIDGIAAGLGENPALLHQPSGAAPARHHTLQATLEWSYRLLAPQEQLLFHRLSAFAGTFSLLAAESAAGGNGIDRIDVASLLETLVGKSLVQVADRGTEHRYRLLETVRQYGEAKLAASTELTDVFRAHARFYLALAGQAATGLAGPDQARWLDRLELEHDNLSVVLRRELPAEPEAGGQLAGRLWPFWHLRGHYHEARSWLEQATDLAGEMSPPVRAAVLTGAGALAFLQCDYELAAERLSHARALHEELDDQVGVAGVLQRLGSIARKRGRYEEARRLHEESMAVWARLEEAAGVAESEDHLGFVAWLAGDYGQASVYSSRALDFFQATGRSQATAAALINLGAAARHGGDSRRAGEWLAEALTISRQIGYLEGVAWALAELGAMTAGSAEAGHMLRESLRTHFQLGDRWRMASVIEAIAAMVAERQPATAATLLSMSDALRRRLGTPVPPAERPGVDSAQATVRRALGTAQFTRSWGSGQSMPLADAVELACQAAGIAREMGG